MQLFLSKIVRVIQDINFLSKKLLGLTLVYWERSLACVTFTDVFPQPFEGCKLVINKGLSNHFQVSHTLQLSGMGPGAYHFGATYVGNKQMGPNEVTEDAIDVSS